MVNGERRYVRRTTFTSSQKDRPIHTRFVYDYRRYFTLLILMCSHPAQLVKYEGTRSGSCDITGQLEFSTLICTDGGLPKVDLLIKP